MRAMELRLQPSCRPHHDRRHDGLADHELLRQRADSPRTPFLDKLSATGVTFDNAYTPSPICIPCRQSMAVGQRPRTCGVERYGQDLPPNSMTFARRLGQFGYETCCAGKLHHMGPDQMQGWMRRIGGKESHSMALNEAARMLASEATSPSRRSPVSETG